MVNTKLKYKTRVFNKNYSVDNLISLLLKLIPKFIYLKSSVKWKYTLPQVNMGRIHSLTFCRITEKAEIQSELRSPVRAMENLRPIFIFPTFFSTFFPSFFPTFFSTFFPTFFSTFFPTFFPTFFSTFFPTFFPTFFSTFFSTFFPTFFSTLFPTLFSTFFPTFFSTFCPTFFPTFCSTFFSTFCPTFFPTFFSTFFSSGFCLDLAALVFYITLSSSPCQHQGVVNYKPLSHLPVSESTATAT